MSPAYIATTWQDSPATATPITAANLNHIEQGVVATATTVPSNVQTGTAYTLALSDAGGVVEMNNAAANVVTIATNASVAFPLNTVIEVFQYGAGQTSIAGASGVTVRAPAGLKIAMQYASAVLRQRATDEWVIAGATTT